MQLVNKVEINVQLVRENTFLATYNVISIAPRLSLESGYQCATFNMRHCQLYTFPTFFQERYAPDRIVAHSLAREHKDTSFISKIRFVKVQCQFNVDNIIIPIIYIS